MKTNEQAIKIIKEYEKFHPKTYLCSIGIRSIGYKHELNKQEKFQEPISEQMASNLLKKDLIKIEDAIFKFVKVRLNPNQFSSLVSFVYDIGISNFCTSKLLRVLNYKRYDLAYLEFNIWIREINGEVSSELINRRKKEQELFKQ